MHDPVRQAQLRLVTLLGLSEQDARRAVAEVLDSFSTSVDEYIQARHSELQAHGAVGREIYESIAQELPLLRFPGPELTARQVRRRVYG